MIGLSSLLYGPIYATLGVPAVLRLGADGAAFPLTVIDRTSGVEVANSGSVDLLTVKPAAAVRVSDLARLGVALGDVDGSFLLLNGRSWRVRAHMLRPGPEGELEGEVYLVLSGEAP